MTKTMRDIMSAAPEFMAPGESAFAAANEKMMHDMNQPLTGNVDRDFVAGMIPHHQGAIDMARVELKYGKDPEIQRLARAVIAAQEQERARREGVVERVPGLVGGVLSDQRMTQQVKVADRIEHLVLHELVVVAQAFAV